MGILKSGWHAVTTVAEVAVDVVEDAYDVVKGLVTGDFHVHKAGMESHP